MPPPQPSAALLQGARVQSPRTPQHVRPLHLQQPIGARAHAGSPQAWPAQNVSAPEMRRPQGQPVQRFTCLNRESWRYAEKEMCDLIVRVLLQPSKMPPGMLTISIQTPHSCN